MRSFFSASVLVALAGGSCLSAAAWGVRYEVDTGGGWTRNATVDVTAAARSVAFRVVAFHDGNTMVLGRGNVVRALNPLRLCMTHRVENFGSAANGDALTSFDWSVQTGNPTAKEAASSGPNTIIGRTNSGFSFASNLADGLISPPTEKHEVEFFRGRIQIGNSSANALNRLLTFTANSLGFPSASAGDGGPFGASFLYAGSTAGASGVAQEAGLSLDAQITVIPTVGTSTPLLASLLLAARRTRRKA